MPCAGLERPDAFQEAGRRDAQLHGLGIVAVDAGDRVLDQLARLHVRHVVQRLEALDQVAVAELVIGGVQGGVAVEAGARL